MTVSLNNNVKTMQTVLNIFLSNPEFLPWIIYSYWSLTINEVLLNKQAALKKLYKLIIKFFPYSDLII